MKKFIKITLSLVLAVILLATAMPIYAVEDDSIKEVEELREENVKHFEMPDGTFKAIVYGEPVHRKDADGKWQDIDNTLSSEKENGNTNYSSFDGRIKFSKNIKNANGKILELSENGYKISFSLIDENIKSTSADVKNHKGKKTPTVFDSEKEKLDKLQSVDNLTKVRYNDIRKDIDLEYEIYANNIKESIIVNSKQSDYVYKFELKLNKLLAILNEDGSISLIDEESGEEKYTMPAPFMFDDNGELSTDVYYTLTQNGKYKYELTVTADKEWINDSERKFPVTIDPTLDATNCYYEEAYVSSSNPYSNYSKPSDGRLFVGSTKRIFLKFELPTISGNCNITSAYLIMHFYFYASMYGSMSIGAYSVPYSWNENTITWNNSVASHQSADNFATILSTNDVSSNMSATEYSPMILPFDVTEAVNDWYMGEDNNGIAIKRMSGMTNDIAFEGYNSALYNIPVLEFTYTIEDDYAIINGEFYIRNVKACTYMQSGAANASLQAFDGGTDQKWVFTHLNNGYHKITSSSSGKTLTAPSTVNASFILSDYNSSNNQMWRITQDANGFYRLSPRSNPSYFISVSGTDVNIMSSQPDNKDEWLLYQASTDGVQFEPQKTEHWCWAACLKMLISAYIVPPVSQEAIAVTGHLTTFVKDPTQQQINNASDQEADKTLIMRVLALILGNTHFVTYNFEGSLEEYDLRIMLNSGDPIIAEVGGGSHYVLIYGYCYENGQLKFNVYDPIYNDGTTNHQKKTFNELSIEWVGSVAMDLEYINN